MAEEEQAGASIVALPAPSRRDLAVARVLDPARSRAEIRLQRFLDAAAELLISTPGKEFTVQEVVARSGQSLRSFYQYFDGKHELLLALFEDTVRETAEHLRARVEAHDAAEERLRCFAVEYARLCRPRPQDRSSTAQLVPVLTDFAQRLLTDHAEEARRAFLPVTSLLQELLQEAASVGVVRTALGPDAVGVVMQSIMFSSFSSTIAGVGPGAWTESDAEDLWDLLRSGLSRTSVASAS